MAYAVDVPRRVRKEMDALPASVRDRVIEALTALKAEPRPPGCVKLKGSVSEYRIRVGDYRIRYEISDAQQQVTILRVAHRRDMYRP